MEASTMTDENDYPYKSEAQRRWTERIDTYPLKRIIDLTGNGTRTRNYSVN